MNIETLMCSAEKQHIHFQLSGDDLIINRQKGQPDLSVLWSLKQHKAEIVQHLKQKKDNAIDGVVTSICHKYGLSVDEVKAAADVDWGEIIADSEWLEAFAMHLYERKLMEKGEIPPGYDTPVHCKSCDQVVLLPNDIVNGGKVLGCPWC